MDQLELSLRLQTIADYVPEGSRMADIGSDHALLPVVLAAAGRIAHAVAGEVNEGPYQSALRQVRKRGLESLISVRRGDGLTVLERGEADVIVIAGMGGALICRILEEGKDRLEGVRRLVLQPNVAEDQVRRWLKENGWMLVNESIVEEDGHFYEIMAAAREAEGKKHGDSLYGELKLPCGLVLKEDMLLKFGPLLVRSPNPVFLRKWTLEADKLEKICKQIEQSAAESARSRLHSLREEVRQIREVTQCLQMDKR